MNLFFILMMVIMGTRTVYYIVMHFLFQLKPTDRPTENNYLIAIYLQEIVFNFVVFYNLVLKQGHQEKHFEPQYRRATTRYTKNRPVTMVVPQRRTESESLEEEGDAVPSGTGEDQR